MPTPFQPARIASRFTLSKPVDSVAPFGDGLINDTFLVTSGDSRYVLQRINERVFPEPERIMGNLAVLHEHLAHRPRAGLRIPALVPARDGQPFVRGNEDGIWRLMELIPNVRVLKRVETPEQAREVGRALGRFHRSTRDLEPGRLAVTLPGFHVTPRYLERFAQVLTTGKGARYMGETRDASAFVAAHRHFADVLETSRCQGRVRVRVIHGDPKLDNILFDRDTLRAVSLIDLDTVQPGLMHYDLGDCLRSCCNRSGESPDTETQAGFDLEVCGGVLGAYADQMRVFLTRTEIGLIFDSIRLIPYELGLRYLTDHLEGDRYFRITESGQNLRKALVQFALVEDIERKEKEIRCIIAQCFADKIHTRERL